MYISRKLDEVLYSTDKQEAEVEISFLWQNIRNGINNLKKEIGKRM